MKRQVDHRGRLSINLRLPAAMVEELEAAADERAVGRSWLAERLIAEGLARLIPVEELTWTRPPGRPSDQDETGEGDRPGDQAGRDPVGSEPGEAEEAGDQHGDHRGDGEEPDDHAGLAGDDDRTVRGGHEPVIPTRPPLDPVADFAREYPRLLREPAPPPEVDPHAYRQGGWSGGQVRPDWAR